MAQTSPGGIKARLPASPPAKPESFDAIINDVDQIVMPGITTWQHPRFFGYFPSNALLASVLGDYLSTGLGVIGLAWQSSPALTEVEEVATSWMRQMLGLSEAWSGVINDTASTSTLVALLCARERSSNYSLSRGGLQGEAQPLVVYASAQSHSSVEKAALLAGFGKQHVRIVPHDGSYAMRPESLDAMIQSDLDAGLRPCAVVATTGTTTSTALDPLEAIGRVARARGIWMHVDAAMAGSAMILPGMPVDVAGRRTRRLGDRQRPQVARRGVRLHVVFRPRPRAPGSRDVHEAELSAERGRWTREELPRLGPAARAPLPCA